MLRHVAIIYGSAFGQTAKIAFRMRNVLLEHDVLVAFLNAEALVPGFDLSGFDGVIIGSSVIAWKHGRAITRFVHAHREPLSTTPSAFFSVSGSAGSIYSEKRTEARSLMDRFLEAARWNPRLRATFGGAVAYTRYPFFIRWIMKRIARKEGAPTDTTRDHEMTNWEEVDAFAHRFARLVGVSLTNNPPIPRVRPAKRRTERVAAKV